MIEKNLEKLALKVLALNYENKKLKDEIKKLKLLLGKNKNKGGAIG